MKKIPKKVLKNGAIALFKGYNKNKRSYLEGV